MDTRTPQRIAEDRAADLHYAFQFGQDFVRSGDPKVAEEFTATFAGDTEAKAEYDRGVVHEHARMARAN